MSEEKINSVAKLNLFLDIIGRNHKNYHELFALFCYIDLLDEITIAEHSLDGVYIECRSDHILPDDFFENNLFTKAYNWYRSNINPELSTGFKIELQKNIPLGGGLGGGSSNAACFLAYLAKRDNVSYTMENFKGIAYEIGADIPFFLFRHSSYIASIGEDRVLDVSFPKVPVVVINPGINVNTGKVFSNLETYSSKTDYSKLIKGFASIEDLLSFLEPRENKLEEVALKIFPELFSFKQDLLRVADAELIRMSGSGSSYFCLFKNEKRRDACKDRLKQYFPDCFVHSGYCLSSSIS